MGGADLEMKEYVKLYFLDILRMIDYIFGGLRFQKPKLSIRFPFRFIHGFQLGQIFKTQVKCRECGCKFNRWLRTSKKCISWRTNTGPNYSMINVGVCGDCNKLSPKQVKIEFDLGDGYN